MSAVANHSKFVLKKQTFLINNTHDWTAGKLSSSLLIIIHPAKM